MDQATAAEFVGIARAVNQMCSSVGYDPTELPDVAVMFIQDLLLIMQSHLATGFQRRTGRGLDIRTLVRFITCVFAGTYNEAYSNLAADSEQYGNERYAFMRFEAEMPVEDSNAIAQEIDGRMEDVRPGFADPLLESLRAQKEGRLQLLWPTLMRTRCMRRGSLYTSTLLLVEYASSRSWTSSTLPSSQPRGFTLWWSPLRAWVRCAPPST